MGDDNDNDDFDDVDIDQLQKQTQTGSRLESLGDAEAGDGPESDEGAAGGSESGGSGAEGVSGAGGGKAPQEPTGGADDNGDQGDAGLDLEDAIFEGFGVVYDDDNKDAYPRLTVYDPPITALLYALMESGSASDDDRDGLLDAIEERVGSRPESRAVVARQLQRIGLAAVAPEHAVATQEAMRRWKLQQTDAADFVVGATHGRK